jgi:hypothetical protein
MALLIKPPYPPMEALSVDKILTVNSWRYNRAAIEERRIPEPLLPGPDCGVTTAQSKKIFTGRRNCHSLGLEVFFRRSVATNHPAESRIKKLANTHPAADCFLFTGRGPKADRWSSLT